MPTTIALKPNDYACLCAHALPGPLGHRVAQARRFATRRGDEEFWIACTDNELMALLRVARAFCPSAVPVIEKALEMSAD